MNTPLLGALALLLGLGSAGAPTGYSPPPAPQTAAPADVGRLEAQDLAELRSILDRNTARARQLDAVRQTLEANRKTAQRIENLLTEIAEAQARDSRALAELMDRARAQAAPIVDPPPVDPPPVEPPVDPPVEPPVVDPPVDPPASSYYEPPPDFSGAPFADIIPLRLWPKYHIPTADECDWIVEDGEIRSQRDLGTIKLDKDGTGVGFAYRASMEAGHEKPIKVGIVDNAGDINIGGKWYHSNGRSVVWKDPTTGQYDDELSIEIVGLSPEAESMIGWSMKYGFPARIGVYNLTIRGGNDSMVIRANDGIGTLIFDGCTFAQSPGFTRPHDSGMHTDGWETLVIRRQRYTGTRFNEHENYLKSSRGVTWIVENDFRGGNRTGGFQIRPGSDDPGNDEPVGPVVIAFNTCRGYGFEHPIGPQYEAGGAALTVWSSPTAPVFVYANIVTDARYKCLMLGGQGAHRDWYNSDGFPIHSAYIAGNVFSNPRSRRDAVGISAVGDVHVWDNTLLDGARWVFDSEWHYDKHGIENGSVTLYGTSSTENYMTYSPTKDRTVPIEPGELEKMRVPSEWKSPTVDDGETPAWKRAGFAPAWSR
jgi:hypothetical protein